MRDNEGLGVKRYEVSKVRFCSDFEGLLGVLCDVLCVVLFSGKLRASSKGIVTDAGRGLLACR